MLAINENDIIRSDIDVKNTHHQSFIFDCNKTKEIIYIYYFSCFILYIYIEYEWYTSKFTNWNFF